MNENTKKSSKILESEELQAWSENEWSQTWSAVLTTLTITKNIDQNQTIAKLPSFDWLSDVQKAFVEMFDMLLKKNEFANAFDIAAKGKLPREFYLYALTYYIEDFKKEGENEYQKKHINKFYDSNINKRFMDFLETYILPNDIFTKEQLIAFFSVMLQEEKEEDREWAIFDIGLLFMKKEFMAQYYDSDFLKIYIKQLFESKQEERRKVSMCEDILDCMVENSILLPEEEKNLFMKRKIAYWLRNQNSSKDKEVNGILTLAKKFGYTLEESEKKILLNAYIYDLNIHEILLYLDEFGNKELRMRIFMDMAVRWAQLYKIDEILRPQNQETELFSPEEINTLCEKLVDRWFLEILLQVISKAGYKKIPLDINGLVDRAVKLWYIYDARKIAKYAKLQEPEYVSVDKEVIKKSLNDVFDCVIPYIAQAPYWDRYNNFFKSTAELKKWNFFPERKYREYNDTTEFPMDYPEHAEMFKEFVEKNIEVFLGIGNKETKKEIRSVLEILRAYVPLLAIIKAEEKVKHKGIISIYRGPVIFNDSVIVNKLRRYYIWGNEYYWCANFLQYKSPTECSACKKTEEKIYDVRISHLIKKQAEDRVYRIPDETVEEKVLEIFTGYERKNIIIVDTLIEKMKT